MDATTPGATAQVPALPADLLIALAPREAKSNDRRLWVLRIGAVGVVLLVLLLMVAMNTGRPQ